MQYTNKELKKLAQGISDHVMELMYDTVEWQIADLQAEGDDYNDLHSKVMKLAILNMYLKTK